MKRRSAMSSREKTYILMILPALILFVAFNTIPLITGAIYSFTNYRGYGDYDFVGLRNYIDLFGDERVRNSYLFTFKYAIAGTVLINVISLLLAMGLNSRIRCKSLLRGVYFIPNILGGLIIGYIFSFIFTYIIPAVGKAMHIGFLENSILASEQHAWIGVLIVGVWQAVAMNTIIYISGLQTVPADIYEAGMIDGANAWQKFWHIIFPGIRTIIALQLILAIKGAASVFEIPYIITGGKMGTSTFVIKTIETGFQYQKIGLASAMAIVLLFIIIVITMIQKIFFKEEK